MPASARARAVPVPAPTPRPKKKSSVVDAAGMWGPLELGLMAVVLLVIAALGAEQTEELGEEKLVEECPKTCQDGC